MIVCSPSPSKHGGNSNLKCNGPCNPDENGVGRLELKPDRVPMVVNTDVKTKAQHWPIFEKMIRRQFEHGGEKYKLGEDKEITDWVCELSPGETGADWVLLTMEKYIGRYKSFKLERDLLKIATYAYIMWLKMGHHLDASHDEDVSSVKKDVEEA